MRGVIPSLSAASTSAPASIMSRTHSTALEPHAAYSGVIPCAVFCVRGLREALASRSSFTHEAHPWSQADHRAVYPLRSGLSTEALAARSSAAHDLHRKSRQP